MKQIIQDLHQGDTQLIDVPRPTCRDGSLLISSSRTLISAGTERMLVDFGKGSYLAKARSQPEKVAQVLDKIKTDGLLTTIDAVRNKLNQPIALGYCNAGRVIELGRGVTGFSTGDRVVSNGHHAELVCIPKNLCAKIPDSVSDDSAAFAVLASVALQAVRLVHPTLGESVVVTGLGLVGLMAVQILQANGCRVLAIDFNRSRLALARQFGADVVDLSMDQDPVRIAQDWSHGRGVDAVLLATATADDTPVHQAAQMSRQRGRIVLVGVAGLHLKRADFYEKELSFQVSCSYGPGRYDDEYEVGGHDYPFGLVRWTEQRNLEAVLYLMAEHKLNVTPLISHRFSQHDGVQAYQMLSRGESSLGILLTYPEDVSHIDSSRTVRISEPRHPQPSRARESRGGRVTVGVIGAGDFTVGTLLPALKRGGAQLHSIVSAGGTSASLAARRFGFQFASTDRASVLENPDIQLVLVATRHHTHAQLAIEAMEHEKFVFLEKPVAITREQLADIGECLAAHPQGKLMVGFNRRFAPLVIRMRRLLAGRSQPVSAIYTVNAGFVPDNHWVHDPEVGGGRIIGEGCHFMDTLRFLVDQPIVDVSSRALGTNSRVHCRDDNITVLLRFSDGSMGVIHYLANGSKRFPKERIEVFGEGKVLALDNFQRLTGYGWKSFRSERLWRQDKGHRTEIATLLDCVASGSSPPIPWVEIEEVTRASFDAVDPRV